MRTGPRKPPPLTHRSDPQPRIETGLRDLLPLRLLCVEQGEDVALFNEYLERHHYLGYRQPRGPRLRYFLLDRQGRRLGCLLFSQATPLAGLSRRVDRLTRGPIQEAPGPGGEPAALPGVSLGAREMPGVEGALAGPAPAAAGLAAALSGETGSGRDVCGRPALPGHVLPGGQLAVHRPDPGACRCRADAQGRVRLPLDARFPLGPAARAAPAGPPAVARARPGGPRRGLHRAVAGPDRCAQRAGRRP